MEKMNELISKWNNHYKNTSITTPVAAVLHENSAILPKKGIALDIGCGTGANSYFLANLGMEVHAWDFSEVAIQLISSRLKGRENINIKNLNITKGSFANVNFDLVLCCHYLDRKITDEIYNATKIGGLIIYQTFTEEKKRVDGPSNPDYLLKYKEVFSLIKDCRVLAYREQPSRRFGDSSMAGKAYIIGQKK
ncbi:MAG: tellurite resistance methyltransferase TehB [Gammaproteobacteria bacterium]|nr:tellurite resistance methyltransferase TehB [Gammaproteobacteria bacterium]